MNLCVTSGIFGNEDAVKLTYKEKAKFAKDAGFEEFDLSLEDHLEIVRNGKEFYLKAVKDIEKEGIGIKYTHLPFWFPAKDDFEGWESFKKASFAVIDISKEIGAECSAIHPLTFMTNNFDKDDEYETQLKFLEPYVEYAEKKNYTLALENMRGGGASAHQKLRRFCTDVEDVIKVADHFGIGICWDTGHGNISLQNQTKSLRKIGDRLRMCHINDNFTEDDVHTPPFIGKLDWNEIMKAFKEVGYNGSLNLEVGCRSTPVETRKYLARYIAESGKYLIKLYNEA